MKKAILIFICILFFSNILHAGPQKLQIKYPLTEKYIEEAIKEGLDGKRASVRLVDHGTGVTSRLMGGGTTGFEITILTPYARIVTAAYEAKRKYMNFTREDVTEGMLAPVMLIIIDPDKPYNLTEVDAGEAQNVEHVVLADIQKKMIIQPSAIEFFNEELRGEAGAVFTFKGAYVEFPIEEVIKVSKRDYKGEFFIKVIGTRKEKEFKIKEKHVKNIK